MPLPAVCSRPGLSVDSVVLVVDHNRGRAPLSPPQAQSCPSGMVGELLPRWGVGAWTGLWDPTDLGQPPARQLPARDAGRDSALFFLNTVSVHIPKSTIWEAARRSRTSILRWQGALVSPHLQQHCCQWSNAHSVASP